MSVKKVVVTILLIFGLSVFIWRLNSPFPDVLGWDIYAHQSLFNAILNGNISLWPSKISDSFLIDAYLPVFALLLGGLRYIFFFLSLAQYYVLMDTIYLLCVVAVSFSIAYVVTKSYWHSFIAGLFGALIFESVIAQTAFFFLPQGVSSLLVIAAIILWISQKYPIALVLVVIANLFHFVIGALGLLIIAILALKKRVFRENSNQFFFLAGLFLIASLIVGVVFDFDPFSTMESTRLSFSLIEKYDYILRWYTYLWILFPIGAWHIFRQGTELEKTITAISFILLGLVVFPIPYSFKFYTVGRYLVHVIMAIGFWSLIPKKVNLSFHIGFSAALAFVLAVLLVYNQSSFKEAMLTDRGATTLSKEELSAAEHIVDRYGNLDGLLIVSDPATQQVFEALTGINTQGGAFSSKETRRILDDAFPKAGLSEVAGSLFKVRDAVINEDPKNILFVVSGRFMAWQRLPEEKRYDDGYNIWAPRELSREGITFIQELNNDKNFYLTYVNNSVAVFQVHKPIDNNE